MWQTSRGILLKKTTYADHKYILKIFTPHEGVESFSIHVPGDRKKSVARSVIGQPMALTEFTFFNKPNREIRAIKSINVDEPYQNIPHDVVRQTILLFMNEMILQTIRLPMQDEKLYHFVRNALLTLDKTHQHRGNFPIWFAVSLALQLGIGIKKPELPGQTVFDLVSAGFSEPSAFPGIAMSPELSGYLQLFLGVSSPPEVSIPRADRHNIMSFLLDYFTYHADFDPHIKSADILSIVFQVSD